MTHTSDFLPTQPPDALAGARRSDPASLNAVDLALPLVAPARRARVLLVDDQPMHLQVLRRALVADYQLFVAASGPQALRVCREQQPDLVLLDVVMPDMDGFQVLQQLKGDPDTTDTPVIFVTAHGGDEIETQCLMAGAVDFISKPVNASVVRARVKTHLTLKFQSDLLRDLAFLDGLTGVSNRRQFDERLALEWGRAQRNGTPLSLILLDVDFFKAYNDHYGHQAGDVCLQQLASVLKANLRRPTDLVARYGGEEFVCLLPDAPLEEGLAMAHKLLQAVKQQAIAHQFSGVADVVTVSLGVATRQGEGSAGATAADLLALADAQLYHAKHAGRAQACGAVLQPVVAAS
jgi:diguanylate cyclase (GGDEF)-like protein